MSSKPFTPPTSDHEHSNRVDHHAVSLQQSDAHMCVGKIGRAHGLHGMLFVQSYTDPADNLFAYTSLMLAQGQPVVFLEHRRQGKQYVARIEGCNDCDQARILTNQSIYMAIADLPPLEDGQFYWHQLTGCEVCNLQGHVFGRVDYMHDGAQFPLLVVKNSAEPGKPETLIPYEPSVVQAVELGSKRIVVDWVIEP